MGFLDDVPKLDATEGLIFLSGTTQLTPDLMEHQCWREISDDYAQDDLAPEQMIAVSIINAALTHKRRFFVLTRDGVEKLVREDRNWAGRGVFNSKAWKKYKRFLFLRKILREVPVCGKNTVYELTHEKVAKYLPIREGEEAETIAFAERKKSSVVAYQSTQSSLHYDQRRPTNESVQASSERFKPHTPDPEMKRQILERFPFFRSDYVSSDDDIL